MDVETKFSIACQSGNLTTVKLLSITHKNYIKNNCLESGIYYASMYGHLKIIKFLEYFFGTKGDSFDLSTAADEGHLDVVKYFVESGVPIENNAILWATEHGHTNIVEYLTSVKNIKNANTFLILTNTGRIRRRGLLRSFRPKKERPYVPPEIAEKIMSYLEFGRSRRSRKITKKQRPQSRKRSIKRKMSYTIELAKTGRSKCKACGENIENQAVRFSSGSDRYVVWRHFPQCMTERIKNNVLVAFPNPEDIPGVDNLESKEIVTNYFNGEKETKKSVKKTKKESEEESTGSDKPTKKTKEKIELEVLLAKTLELNKKGEFPDIKGWWISEKLDGIRAYWSHKDKKLYTRSGFVIDTPAWFTKELPKDMDFDGEIWISRKLEDFNKVSGIGRKTRKTEADEEAWNTVKYMVFDVPTLEKPYEERLKTYTQVIKKMKNSPHVIPVEAWLAKDVDHVFEELKKIEKKGAEGLMLRQPGSMYERKRSKTLLKVKSFEDDEAIITGYNKGSGKYSELVGAIVAKDKEGNIITLGTGLTDELRKNPPPIGTQIIYTFFQKTKDGHPRHPAYKGIRTDVEFKPKKKTKKESE